MTRRARLFLTLAILLPSTVDAADLTVRDLTSRLYHAERGSPMQLGGLDLRDLDLSGLDFKGATLAASNLFGSDLSRADMSKADLKGARLDRVAIIGARFDGAELSDTSFLRPAASRPWPPPERGAELCRRQLSRARLSAASTARISAAPNLSGAMFAPFNKTGFIEHIWRTERPAPTANANLAGADLGYILLALCQLRGANLTRRQTAQGRSVARRSDGCRPYRRRSGRGRSRRRHLTGTRGLDTALGLDTRATSRRRSASCSSRLIAAGAVERAGAGLEGFRVFAHRLVEQRAHQQRQHARGERVVDVEVDLRSARYVAKAPAVGKARERTVDLDDIDLLAFRAAA